MYNKASLVILPIGSIEERKRESEAVAMQYTHSYCCFLYFGGDSLCPLDSQFFSLGQEAAGGGGGR